MTKQLVTQARARLTGAAQQNGLEGAAIRSFALGLLGLALALVQLASQHIALGAVEGLIGLAVIRFGWYLWSDRDGQQPPRRGPEAQPMPPSGDGEKPVELVAQMLMAQAREQIAREQAQKELQQ